ncbi:MAG TPA: cytochrome c nitrite reductase small subunit [Holophagaceae bacterium]|nr:cytochrome c nitrite reductase small subunit [Holophagaceae bacterium]
MRGKFPLLPLSLVASLLVGLFVGSGLFTFITANGTSYLSNDPSVCVNCHIMQEQYDGWRHGSHHAVAVCNDCHLPHENVAMKFYVKASNGYHHSKAFTFQDFAEPIRIKPGNAEVLENNCIRCHGELTGEITAHGTLGVPSDPTQKADLYGCVRCHGDVGHGPRR